MFSFLLLLFFPLTASVLKLLMQGGLMFVVHDGNTFLLINFIRAMQQTKHFETYSFPFTY